jgi:hypothetical protein
MTMDDDEYGTIGGMSVRKTEVLGENRPQCRFTHHKSRITSPGLEPGPPRWEAATNCLNYGLIHYQHNHDLEIM